LTKNLKNIRLNVAGVVVAYHFWAEKKGEFVVVERFVPEEMRALGRNSFLSSFQSTKSMFEYGNSKYHEGLVAGIVKLVESPIEGHTDQDASDELHNFRTTDQAVHFRV
jgi:hypothetical protein